MTFMNERSQNINLKKIDKKSFNINLSPKVHALIATLFFYGSSFHSSSLKFFFFGFFFLDLRIDTWGLNE